MWKIKDQWQSFSQSACLKQLTDTQDTHCDTNPDDHLFGAVLTLLLALCYVDI